MPANVDPNLCTHIIYSFAKLEPSNYAINVTEWNDITIGGKGRIEEIMDLKLRNPNLKILLGLAGKLKQFVFIITGIICKERILLII